MGSLLALLSELDGEAFAAAIEKLRGRKLNAMHACTVEVMAGRLDDDAPVVRVGPGVPVHVAKDVPNRARVAAEIEKWSHTPGLDLDQVARVNVIMQVPGMDYLGRYNLFFSGIILVWPGSGAGPEWLGRLIREHVFCHEVGHHACGHIEGGQVTEQEREADDFAGRMMRAAHPVLIPAARWVFWPLRGWARRNRLRRERLSQ